MKCSEAMHEVLEADLNTLAGHGQGRLAQHLQLCSRCRSIADFVLQEEDRLGAQMADAVASPDLDQLLDEALGTDVTVTEVSLPPPTKSIRLRRVGFSLVPLAAAATLVTLFLGGEPSLPGDSYLPPQRTAGLGLEVPEGQNAVVLTTDNPEITVLWFF